MYQDLKVKMYNPNYILACKETYDAFTFFWSLLLKYSILVSKNAKYENHAFGREPHKLLVIVLNALVSHLFEATMQPLQFHSW